MSPRSARPGEMRRARPYDDPGRVPLAPRLGGTGLGGRDGNPKRRMLITVVAALVGAGALVARLVTLQVAPSDQLLASGDSQTVAQIPLQATRGSIVDRNGAELAISVPRTSIAANPASVLDPAGDAARLAAVLGREEEVLRELLSTPDAQFVYLARLVDDETAAAVEALDLPYVWTLAEDARVEPSDGLARSVVGDTSPFQEGIAGIEQQYDTVLKGEPGLLIVEQGSGGRTIPGGERQLEPAAAGADVVLAIDRGLQFEAERVLKGAVDAVGAMGGTILVSRPATGEILVDANVVRPELAGDDEAASGEQRHGPAQSSRANRALTWSYEPGSINKVIAIAGVLEEGLATPDTVRTIPQALQRYDKRFESDTRDSDQDMTLRQVLAASDNPGAITWAEELGEDRFYDYLRRFGLGEVTALGYERESPGSLRPSEEWSGLSLPTIAMGQGVAVTPMQMLVVFNTIANNGVAMPPRLVLGTERASGDFVPEPAEPARTVVSEDTSAALRDMLTAVVQDGTGRRAQLEGYTVAGKTGTAWKPIDGGYGSPGRRKLVTSFVGFLPAHDPQLSVMVVIDEPQDPYATGGNLAAPLFHEVAAHAVRHLRIPPDTTAPATSLPDAEGGRVRAEPQAPADPPPAPDEGEG